MDKSGDGERTDIRKPVLNRLLIICTARQMKKWSNALPLNLSVSLLSRVFE